MSDIKERIVELIISQLKIDPATLDLNKSFTELGADSLDVVEIVINLEDEFNVVVGDDDADNITSIQSAIDYFINKVQKG